MALSGVILELAIVVVAMLVTATLVMVGPRQFAAAVYEFRWRIGAIASPVGALLVVLLVRWSTRDVTGRLSWRIVGQNITPLIFQVEDAIFPRNPVVILQSYQSPALTTFFVFAYIYGYAFLILFPFLAYFSLDEMDDLRALIVAYTVNYGIGLVCYILFIAFGPRNFDPLLFESLLYEAFPQARFLTDQVNEYTNVFPSLHTSLSMTTMFMAWVTREKFPLWAPVASFFAISVVVSTMYLGIHWFSDVVAGTLLALVSVYVGRTYSVEGVLRSVRSYLEGQAGRERKPDHE